MSINKATSICKECCEEFNAHNSSVGLYCSNKCQSDHQYRQYICRWLGGLEAGTVGKNLQLSAHIKRYLREQRGSACSVCGWDDRHPLDEAILTEFDHIDGDASNNKIGNLRVLCPNCHSKTSTFRARNSNSKRVR
jgi:Zn finger protein HypA/HybF involved in hydrogenase expression